MTRQFYFAPVFAAALAVAALAVPVTVSAQPPTQPGQIRGNSALLHIDPKLVEAGKIRIAKMDAARITAQRAGLKVDPAFHVIGNTYSIGTNSSTSYLIKTTDGLILMDATFPNTAPMVAENIKALGFKLADIKVLLGSHSHGDHVGGMAFFRRAAPNAKLYVMDADAPIVEKGVKNRNGEGWSIEPVKVDQVVHDGEKITLGDVTITAYKTAGHTPGATSYEWKTTEGGKTYDVVLVGSQQAAEKLVPEGYPGIADDQVLAWTRLLSLRPDVWFGGHEWQHDNVDKYAALKAGVKPNPYIDPVGYRELISARAYDFVQELRRQQAAAAGANKPAD
jgi:metallo-beta-lactamase class B